MSYLRTYGTKYNRKFQEGGMMAPAPAEAPAEAQGPAGEGGGGEEQIIALAEAAAQGDQEAAMQLGMMLAPMILQEAQAQMGGGGAEAAPAPEEGTPVFQRGGKFLGRI